MHPDYYNWLFHTTLFADEFYKWGHGIVADLWTTRWQEMKSITVPVPEYAEQERIAAFWMRSAPRSTLYWKRPVRPLKNTKS